jgi:DNA invertase Pin-like site-specific DNA recombinase
MAEKERELISERTKAALATAKARGARLGGDRGYRPATGPNSGAATVSRRAAAERAAHRLLLEVDRLRGAGVTTMHGLARALTKCGIPAPRGGEIWTHTTVGRLLARAEVGPTRT